MVRLDAAELVGTSVVTGSEHAQSTSLMRIIDGELFKLSASLAPNPIQALQTLTGTLRVTNTSAIDRTGIFVRARVPLNAVNGFSQSVLGGGSCITSEGSTYCYAGEIVTWNVGSLLAGQTRFVTMPMIVANGTASGRLIALEAYATTDAGEVATLAVQ